MDELRLEELSVAAQHHTIRERDLEQCAKALYRAWVELWLLAGSLHGTAYEEHLAVLEDIVTGDEVRCRLRPTQREALDQFAPMPRCGHCGWRLVDATEMRRRLCTDCALEFITDDEEGDR